MIELPQKLLDEAWDFVFETTLKRCASELEHTTSTEIEQHRALTLLDKVGGKLDVEDYPSNMASADSKSKVLKIEIPQKYLDRYRKLRGERETKLLLKRDITITVVFNPAKFEDMTEHVGGTYYSDGRIVAIQPQALKLNGEETISIVAANRSDLNKQAQEFGKRAKLMKTTLEHELTHLLQFVVFADFHAQQLLTTTPDDSVQKGSDEALDIYFNSPIEFDPWIKSETTKFTQLADGMSEAEQKAAFKKFVSSDLKPSELAKTKGDKERSRFFLALKKYNEPQWKKGVKLLLTRLEQDL